MKLFLYYCDNCHSEHEVFQKEADGHTCPECGSQCRRKYTPTPHKFTFFYGWDSALGAYCDTKKDKERIMREQRVVEN